MAPQTPAHKSIGVRVFMLILAVIVPLAAFDFYNAAQEEKRAVVQVTRDLQGSTREASNKIGDLINASEELLSGLAATDAVLSSNLFTCTRVLRQVAEKFSKYTNFSVVDANKFIVCSSGPLPKPKDVSKSPNIIQAFETKKFAISPFKFGVLTGKPVLVFTKPLIDPFNQVVGTVNNGLSLTWMEDYLSGISKITSQRMAVIDGQGKVMASHPPGVYELGSSIINTQLGKHVLNKTSGVTRFVDERGEDVLANVAQIPRIPNGASVVAFVSLDAVLADTRRRLHIQLGLLLALAGGSLFLGWIGLRLLVQDPIDRLSELAGKVEAGDFNARSGLSYTSGELGALGQAYDRMVAALETRTSALRNSEANYRELVESEEQLIHRYLPDTSEVFVNQAFADFYGGSPDSWVGRRWMESVPKEEQPVVESFLRSRTPHDPTYVYEHMCKNVLGENRWLRWNNRAFFDDEGNPTHFQAVAVDLTDRKTVEHNLEVAMMDARAANRAKSNFLANMSHELRTPLNSIIGFSEMMSSGIMGKLPKTYEEYSGFISSSGHHLLNIINDILDLSKIEAGMLSLDECEVQLGREVMEALSMLQEQAFKNDNHLENKLDKESHFIVRGDRMRIKQVLLNIISNAIKFTEGGSINVEARLDDGRVVLSVHDTGIGMSRDEIDLALRPFGQVDGRHLNKRYEGTGLGLPLAEQLMKMHDGMLKIESVPGQGTTVELIFPEKRTIA